jgi:hypothetical protein
VSRKPARPICPADGALYADVAIGRAAVPELTQEQVSRATRSRLLVLAKSGSARPASPCEDVRSSLATMADCGLVINVPVLRTPQFRRKILGRTEVSGTPLAAIGEHNYYSLGVSAIRRSSARACSGPPGGHSGGLRASGS